MRRCAVCLIALLWLSACASRPTEGRVCKVLPQYLDAQGRQSISPSLFERDAYQFYLRKTPLKRASLRVQVEYKAKGLDWQKAVLRAELRGLVTNSIQTMTFEEPVKKSGLFNRWAHFDVGGDKYKKFGELVAWRVSLWEGDRELSEQESFLWSGVPTH